MSKKQRKKYNDSEEGRVFGKEERKNRWWEKEKNEEKGNENLREIRMQNEKYINWKARVKKERKKERKKEKEWFEGVMESKGQKKHYIWRKTIWWKRNKESKKKKKERKK